MVPESSLLCSQNTCTCPTLSQINPVHVLPSCLDKVDFNVPFTSVSSSWPLSFISLLFWEITAVMRNDMKRWSAWRSVADSWHVRRGRPVQDYGARHLLFRGELGNITTVGIPSHCPPVLLVKVCWDHEFLCIKIQSVPRSKHCVSVIQTSQLMLYREIIAVCSQIHTKHINTLCGQSVELLNVKLAVYIVTCGL